MIDQFSPNTLKARTYGHRALSFAEAKELVDRTTWYHSFELRSGLVTAGVSEMHPEDACNALGVPADLNGMRALDVGAWDGPITLELERRGATAFALDIQDPTCVGFDTACRVTGSKVVHYQGSVYQLPTPELSELDVIVFRGVYYHLKHPILGFERIALALKVGGTVHFEGAGLVDYIEDVDGRSLTFSYPELDNVPLTAVYPKDYAGASNWFIPNATCLRGWIEVAGLDVEWLEVSREHRRLYGVARKNRESNEVMEHPLY